MKKPQIAREFFNDLFFPTRGLDLSTAYSAPRKGTTTVGQNVRAFDQRADRMRGGSRAGLTKYVSSTVAGAFQIQDLALVPYIASASVGTGVVAKSTVYVVGAYIESAYTGTPFAAVLNGNALGTVTTSNAGWAWVGVDPTSSDYAALVTGNPATGNPTGTAFATAANVAAQVYGTTAAFFLAGANVFTLTRTTDPYLFAQFGSWANPPQNLTLAYCQLDWNGTTWKGNGVSSVTMQTLAWNWTSVTFNFNI